MPGKRSSPQPRIAIVGPCASGKTTLAQGLVEHGFRARQIAQEHSYVPQMWQLITKPDILIFVDASFATCTARKQLDWTQREYEEQRKRLAHARQHCDIYLDTDQLNPDETVDEALKAIARLL